MHVRSLQHTGALHRHEQPEGASFTATVHVDVLVIWRHTDGAENKNRFQSQVRAGGDTVESQRHWSTIRGVLESALRQDERRERSEQSTVKDAQWKDRCRGFSAVAATVRSRRC